MSASKKCPLTDFLKKRAISIHAERSRARKSLEFSIHTSPLICVAYGKGGHVCHDGDGKSIPEALECFIKSISGKRVSINGGQNYFRCPLLKLDAGIKISIRKPKPITGRWTFRFT